LWRYQIHTWIVTTSWLLPIVLCAFLLKPKIFRNVRGPFFIIAMMASLSNAFSMMVCNILPENPFIQGFAIHDLRRMSSFWKASTIFIALIGLQMPFQLIR